MCLFRWVMVCIAIVRYHKSMIVKVFKVLDKHYNRKSFVPLHKV